jgi:hypothetical protein
MGGADLDGDQCLEQLRSWAKKGVVEPDVVVAVEGLRRRHQGAIDLRPHCLKKKKELIHGETNRDKDQVAVADDKNEEDETDEFVFVVLGAGAAMGPLETLLRLGAHVVAVDLHSRPETWRRLFNLAKQSPGKLTFPMRKTVGGVKSGAAAEDYNPDADSELEAMAHQAGANLLTEAVAVRNWVASLCPTSTLIVGSYAYLDSADFVKVSVGMDVVAEGVLSRPNQTSNAKSGLAYLCSPTDVFAIPQSARQKSLERWSNQNQNQDNKTNTSSSSSSSLVFGGVVERFTRGTVAPLLLPHALKPNVAQARLKSSSPSSSSSSSSLSSS